MFYPFFFFKCKRRVLDFFFFFFFLNANRPLTGLFNQPSHVLVRVDPCDPPLRRRRLQKWGWMLQLIDLALQIVRIDQFFWFQWWIDMIQVWFKHSCDSIIDSNYFLFESTRIENHMIPTTMFIIDKPTIFFFFFFLGKSTFHLQ